MEDKRTVQEIIMQLNEKYKDDKEALEDIKRAEVDIKYIESQGHDYKGQTPKQRILTLEATLAMWN